MKEAALHDGTVLEFPDGTSDDVIDRTVKTHLGVPTAPMPDMSNLRPRSPPGMPAPNQPPQQSLPPDVADAPQQSFPVPTITVNAQTQSPPSSPPPAQTPIPTMPAMNPTVDSTQIPELRNPGVPMGDDPKMRQVIGPDGKKITLRHLDGDKYEVVDATTPLPDAPQKETVLGRVWDAARKGAERAMPDMQDFVSAATTPATQQAVQAIKNPSQIGDKAVGALGAVAAPFNAVGPAVGQVAAELGADPGMSKRLGRDIDGLVQVSLIPGTTGFSAARAATRGVPTKLQQSVADFKDVGMRPGIGDLTGRPGLQVLDNLSAKMPGGGIARTRGKQNLDAAAAKIDENVKALSPNELNPEIVGQSVKQGVTDWRDRFRGTANKKFDAVGIAKDVPSAATKTLGTLDELTKVAVGAENLSASLVNNRILKMAENFQKDTAAARTLGVEPTIPFDSMKRLRTQVGDLLAGSELISDAPRAALKRVYAALSDDMRATAVATGRGKQFDSANNFWKSGMDRIEKSLQPIANIDMPEKVTSFIGNMSKSAPSGLREIMKSLSPTRRNDVAALALREMGKRAAQTSEDTFSVASWLTDWNAMPAASKNILFNSVPGVRQNLDTIARVADRLKTGTRAAANPGTAPAATHIAAMTAGVTGALSGNVPLALGALGIYGTGLGTQLASRGASALVRGAVVSKQAAQNLVGNAGFLKWLADAVKAPSRSIAGQLHRLATLASQVSPDDRDSIHEYAAALKARSQKETVIGR